MARNRNLVNPVRAATMRKWYARAWWVVRAGLGRSTSDNRLLRRTAMSVTWTTREAATTFVPVEAATPTGLGIPFQASVEDGDDTELLADGTENEHPRNSADLHFCNKCHVFQPLRTKHCKDCARCTRQYDHHCDCVGTCVGKNNRRLFVLYLFLQILEGVVMIQVTSSAFSEEDDINDWLKINALYIVVWFMIICMLLIVVPLFCYQAFLISTNQTSWEHARRSSITYLQNLPDKHSPFDRGIFQNWWVFISNGDGNQWVHPSVAKPMTSHHDDASTLV
ncbi:unnamed protein product [Peronospora destructor]|uniref:Palmitoyltransferase n=1 Tax=Peronospora destructor TaxID=86335 RepID=A0AAV0TBM6_9STRA|nr:unnamed protein product [Peronospora destructor]